MFFAQVLQYMKVIQAEQEQELQRKLLEEQGLFIKLCEGMVVWSEHRFQVLNMLLIVALKQKREAEQRKKEEREREQRRKQKAQQKARKKRDYDAALQAAQKETIMTKKKPEAAPSDNHSESRPPVTIPHYSIGKLSPAYCCPESRINQ